MVIIATMEARPSITAVTVIGAASGVALQVAARDRALAGEEQLQRTRRPSWRAGSPRPARRGRCPTRNTTAPSPTSDRRAGGQAEQRRHDQADADPRPVDRRDVRRPRRAADAWPPAGSPDRRRGPAGSAATTVTPTPSRIEVIQVERVKIGPPILEVHHVSNDRAPSRRTARRRAPSRRRGRAPCRARPGSATRPGTCPSRCAGGCRWRAACRCRDAAPRPPCGSSSAMMKPAVARAKMPNMLKAKVPICSEASSVDSDDSPPTW